jgi:hypothetical protein
MAQRHELEIEIGPDGNVKVHVKGAKGKKCLDYVKLFAALGDVTEQELTSEYYEPETPVGVTDTTKTRTRW